MRHDILIIGIIFFFIGMAINIVAHTVLINYGIDKLVVDLVKIFGFIYWSFSVLTILFGLFLHEKTGLF